MIANKNNQLYGVVTDPKNPKKYTGVQTPSATVTVDNQNDTIRVDVNFAAGLGDSAVTAYPGNSGTLNRELILETREDLKSEVNRAKEEESKLNTAFTEATEANRHELDNQVYPAISALEKDLQEYKSQDILSMQTNVKQLNDTIDTLEAEFTDYKVLNDAAVLHNTSDINTNKQDIIEETARAISAEELLRQDVTTLADTVDANKQLFDETVIRIDADVTTLAKNTLDYVDTQIEQAKQSAAADNADVVQAVADLTADVEQYKQTNNEYINSAVTTLNKSIEDTTDNLTSDISNLNTTLTDKIEAEASRATQAEQQLMSDLTDYTQTTDTKVAKNSADIAAEVQRATEAETEITEQLESKVNNLGEGLSSAYSYLNELDATVQRLETDVETNITNINTNIASVKTAIDAEVAAVRVIAEAARTETEVDGQIDAKITSYNNTTIKAIDERVVANNTAISTEKARAESVEGGLDTRLKAAEAAISTLNAATTFAGTGTYATMQSLDDLKAGSIFVVVDDTAEGKVYNNKEFVYNGATWIELGDTTAELQRINELQNSLDSFKQTVFEEFDSQDNINTTMNAALQTAAEDIQEINQEIVDIKQDITDKIAGVESTITTNQTETTSQLQQLAKSITSNTEDISELTSTVESNKTALENYVDSNISSVNTNVESLNKEVQDLQNSITTEVWVLDCGEGPSN